MVVEHEIASLDDFRARVRALLAADLPPAAVVLRARAPSSEAGQQAGLFASVGASSAAPGAARAAGAAALPARPAAPRRPLPAALAEGVRQVAHHRDAGRWQLLYRLIWRQAAAGAAPVLERRLDPDVVRFERLRAQVRRDVHRCHAFLRFRRLADAAGELWGAWYEPDHDTLPLALPFFVSRLGESRWWVASTRRSAAFDGRVLRWLPGQRPPSPTRAPHPQMAPGAAADDTEGLWVTYFAAIFNPARLNPRAMRQHMPRRFWRHLPEGECVSTLVREATARQETAMRSDPTPRPQTQLSLLGDAAPEEGAPAPAAPATAAHLVATSARDGGTSWQALRESARGCAACPWASDATQTVFGLGPIDASIMLVGEQPGDQEDLRGAPFVGPAGQLLREIMAEVPLDPEACYLTNAVKHFKWTPRGKRRIHQKPSARDIATCRPWLTAEQQALQPRLTIALGLVAAHGLLGKAMRLGDIRGRRLRLPTCDNTWVTSHPSAILRMPELVLQQQARELMIQELRQALASA